MGIFDKMTEKIQQAKNDMRPKFLSVSDEELKKLLIQDESLVSTITQAVSTSATTLVLTNLRIIVYDHGMLSSSFKDYYFRDMKDARFDMTVLSGGTITINADKGNNAGTVTITDLPLQESKLFYSRLQEIERDWWEKKRELELEEKRAAAGGTQISMATPQNINNPTPLPGDEIETKLLKLKGLYEKELIDESEYKERKVNYWNNYESLWAGFAYGDLIGVVLYGPQAPHTFLRCDPLWWQTGHFLTGY